MYTAYYLPSCESDPSKDGFSTEEMAWDWIKENHLCVSCQTQLIKGYHEYGQPGDKDYYKCDMSHPSATSCGAEWGVAKSEDLENSESVEDMFEAIGWEKVYEREAV